MKQFAHKTFMQIMTSNQKEKINVKIRYSGYDFGKNVLSVIDPLNTFCLNCSLIYFAIELTHFIIMNIPPPSLPYFVLPGARRDPFPLLLLEPQDVRYNHYKNVFRLRIKHIIRYILQYICT